MENLKINNKREVPENLIVYHQNNNSNTYLSFSMIFLPVLLSAFTHLWKPIDFPYGPSNDESIYLRRAMYVLNGFGPQQGQFYDHPFFAQFFLAGIFKIVGYPNSFHPSANGDEHSIETLYLLPKIIAGLLAVLD